MCTVCDQDEYQNGLCIGCYDDLCSGSDDALRVAKMFQLKIVELQSTIAAQHDHIEDGAKALEQANETIESLEEQLRSKNEGLWSLIANKDIAIQELVDGKRAQRERIEELESQLSAALATIERSIDADNPGKLYSEGCTP